MPYDGDSLVALAKAKLTRVVVPQDTRVPAWVGSRIARGLEPEPDARYPDMRALLGALADDPHARRRRWIAGSALTVALVGSGYGVALGNRGHDPCELPEGHFDGIWDDEVRARVAASFARPGQSLADVALVQIDDGIGRYLAQWTETRTEICRASLDRKERSIDAASGELECLDRQLRRVAALGSSFGQADDAVVRHAAELVARLPPPANCRRAVSELATHGVARDVALALEERVAQAETLARVGRFGEGLALVDEILVEAEAAGDRTSLLHARLTESQAALDDRKYDRARAAALASHAIAFELGDPSAATRAMVLLVANQRSQGNYAEAALLAELAAGQVAQASPSVQVDLAFQRGALAVDRDQYDEGFMRLAEARTLAESLYGADHLQVADIVILQGIAESSSRRDFDAALAHFGHAAEIYRAHYGEQHPRVASIHNNIGGVYFRQGQWDRGIPEVERSLAIYTAIHGDDHPLTMRALSNLGAAAYQSGDRERAMTLLERALVARERALGKDHPEYVSAEANLAVMLLYGGDPGRALTMTTHVYERTAAMHGEHDPDTLVAAGTLAEVAKLLDQETLVARYDAVVRAGFDELSPDDPEVTKVLVYAATAARRGGDARAALGLAERRVAATRGELDRAAAVADVGDALLALGRHAEAKQRLEAALAEATAGTKPTSPSPVGLLDALARAELALSNRDRARAHYEDIVRRLDGDVTQTPRLAGAHLELARLATDGATRQRHAQACVDVLASTGLLPGQLAAARALLGR